MTVDCSGLLLGADFESMPKSCQAACEMQQINALLRCKEMLTDWARASVRVELAQSRKFYAGNKEP